MKTQRFFVQVLVLVLLATLSKPVERAKENQQVGPTIMAAMNIYGNDAVPNTSASATTQADTIYAASCSQTDVQAAIDSASDGDMVLIPSGTCAWTSGVNWSNKNIDVIGTGQGQTILTGDVLFFNIRADAGYADWRLSGMTLTGTTRSTHHLRVKNHHNSYSTGWRIDHIDITYNLTGSNATVIFIQGVTWGLIDHVNFHASGLMLQTYGSTEDEWNNGTESGYYDHSLPLDLGGPNAVFVEDSALTFDPTEFYSFANDMWTGGRQVWRHNTIINGTFQSHSARGGSTDIRNARRGAVSFEFYNNKMTTTKTDWWRYGQFRSGVLLFFNNTLSGYSVPTFSLDAARVCDTSTGVFGQCDGNSSWDGNIGSGSDAGWPCLDMPGRDGTSIVGNQVTFPSYAWNNGPEDGCSAGGVCTNQANVLSTGSNFERCVPGPPNMEYYVKDTAHANGDIDFCQAATKPASCGNHSLDYTPYTYPHPLTGGDNPPTRSNPSPTGTLDSGTTQTTISLSTDENATCRYGTTAGIPYNEIADTFSSTGSTTHSTTVSGLSDGSTYTYYVRCQDTSDNANPDDYPITFSVAEPLTLRGTPAYQSIHLTWTITGTLPVTSTWQIAYDGPTGDQPSPISGIISPTRAYTLTGLTNYVWYTVTLSAMLDSISFSSDTARVMPTGILVYLPLILRAHGPIR